MLLLYLHRDPGSLRVVRTARRPFQMALYGPRMSNHAFTLLAPESWKSASSQNVSQTISQCLIGSQKDKSGFNSIGTGILEICEWSGRHSRRFMVTPTDFLS